MFWSRVRNSPSRSSKVVDFGTNWKRVRDFLLAINSNFLVLSCPVSEILQVSWEERPHPYSTRILGVSPLDQIDVVAASESEERRPYKANY